MNQLISPYIISIFLAWLLAHLVKYIISLIEKERYTFRSYLFRSGGMPSAHSATVMAVTTVIALRDGVQSGLFGLAIVMATIVMYDAMKVRRSSGEQGDAISKLIKETKTKVSLPRVSKGHTPIEVAAGATLGILIGFIVFFATK
jgi:acid phosphatase family membrane protein YuiD